MPVFVHARGLRLDLGFLEAPWAAVAGEAMGTPAETRSVLRYDNSSRPASQVVTVSWQRQCRRHLRRGGPRLVLRIGPQADFHYGQAAMKLDIGFATLKRLLDAGVQADGTDIIAQH